MILPDAFELACGDGLIDEHTDLIVGATESVCEEGHAGELGGSLAPIAYRTAAQRYMAAMTGTHPPASRFTSANGRTGRNDHEK